MLLLILLLLDLTASEVDDQQYCAPRYQRLCQGKRQHVACQFSSPGPGNLCQNYTKIEFKSDLRHFVINYINRRRQRIASGNERVRGGAHLPRPEIMMLVSWDRELAYLAQRLADQCDFVHDDCRATVRFPYAGQSVGEVRWRRSSDSDRLSTLRVIRRVLDAWWGERRRVQIQQLVTPFRLNPKGGGVWGHFSQLAVWTLRAVGCGAVRHGLEHTRMLLVCDFSHTNMLGQRTLVPGPLAPCPAHTVRRPRTAYPLLCAPVRRQISSENDNYEKEKYKDDYDDDFVDEYSVTTVQSEATSRIKIVKTATSDKHLKVTLLGYDNGSMNFNTRINYLDGPTSQRILEKLQHELEFNNNEKQLVPMTKYQEWVTKRPYFARLREDQENVRNTVNTYETDEEVQPSLLYNKKFTTELIFMTKKSSISRQRWRQTRLRPQRPGVNALIKRPIEKCGSLKLDQDDVDQLYRDTGFNVNWRHQFSLT